MAPGHWPYFVLKDDEVIGFSMVRRVSDASEVFDLGQFFMLRAHRHAGASLRALELTLVAHPGVWQVRVLPKNMPAVAFWRKATRLVAKGRCDERIGQYGAQEMIFFRFRA